MKVTFTPVANIEMEAYNHSNEINELTKLVTGYDGYLVSLLPDSPPEIMDLVTSLLRNCTSEMKSSAGNKS